jgi:hypothetical protein
MSHCGNRWDGNFRLSGSGLTEKKASDDFQARLDKELKARIETSKCSEKDCVFVSGLGDDAEKKCLFTYRLDGDDKPKEVEREVMVLDEGKFAQTKVKSWERTSTVKYGCWCLKPEQK